MATDNPCRRPAGGGRFFFETALVFLVFFVLAGDRAPHVNEAHYLCRLKHFWDPAYCAGDLFLESPDAHFTVVWLFGWVTRLISLEATAWLGRLLSWTLLAIGWRRLFGRLTGHGLLAPLGAVGLVAATRELNFAGEWIVGGFEAKSLAYGFVLLALTDAIDGRWNRAWLGLGAASALHALVGGWSVLALGAVAVFQTERPPWRRMAPGLVGGGLLALAGVAPALALNVGTPAETVDEANQIYVFFRLPHHLALLHMRTSWLTDRALRHGWMIAGLLLMTLLRWRTGDRTVRLLLGFAWAAEGISLAGLAVSLVGWDHPAWAASLLKYYWHRLADVAAPIGTIGALAQWLGSGLSAQRLPALATTASATLLAVAYTANVQLDRHHRPHAPADRMMHDPGAWIAMQRWIRENTEPDAVFLVPRLSHSFKWRAERAEVATHKDVPQDAASMVAWRDRYSDIYQWGAWPSGKPKWTPSVARRGAAKLRELAARYGADYALDQSPRLETRMPLQRKASLPIVHREGPYTLYDLRESGQWAVGGGQ